MVIEQFFVEGLAHLSYLVGGREKCAVIDPARDIAPYLDSADRHGMRITHVLETHLHADFVSGHLDLARATGARIYAPAAAGCRFPHRGLSTGDRFKIEDISFLVEETPGHTPEHVSYIAGDLSRGREPVAVFCGDTLFVGDVGRPDLFPGRARELASSLYRSLREKLMALPDGCLVYPAHGAGSLCGRSIGAMRVSTIGCERRLNRSLALENEGDFIESLTVGMPPAPDHFSRCSRINGTGPALVSSLPDPAGMEPREFGRKIEKGAFVLDTRTYDSFCGAHVPGSLSIGLGGNFATWTGWLLPPDRDIVLVTGEGDVPEVLKRLRSVGLDRVRGVLSGGIFEWAAAGLPTGSVGLVSGPELERRLGGGEPLQLVDVRSSAEYSSGHIEGSINIPLPELRQAGSELDPAIETILLCSGGPRSVTGASLLAPLGFRRLACLAGGFAGYSAAGFRG